MEPLCSGGCTWHSTPAVSCHLYNNGEKVDTIIAGLVHPEMSLGETEKHV